MANKWQDFFIAAKATIRTAANYYIYISINIEDTKCCLSLYLIIEKISVNNYILSVTIERKNLNLYDEKIIDIFFHISFLIFDVI